VAAFEAALAERAGRAHAVAVGSGTDAVYFALRAAGVRPGDEVLVPDFAFVGVGSAVLRAGARPVWVDVDDHGVLDLAAATAALGPRTTAVVALGLYGRPLDPAAFEGFAARHGLALVEDAAQGLGGAAGGRPAGAVGEVSCFSFDPTKPLSAPGSGGAVVTDDAAAAAAVRRLRWHGAGEDGAIVERGYNSQLPTTSAAVLLAMLEHEAAWRARRRAVAARYDASLAGSAVVLPAEAPGTVHAFHRYVIRVPDRDRVRAALAAAGVEALVHYPTPLHAHPAFADVAPAAGTAPRAARLAATVLSLPLHPFLADDEVERVAAATLDALSPAG